MGNTIILLFFIKKVVGLVIVPLSVIVPIKTKGLRLVCVLAKPSEEGDSRLEELERLRRTLPGATSPGCKRLNSSNTLVVTAIAGASRDACSCPVSSSRRVPDCGSVAAACPFAVRREHRNGSKMNAFLVPEGIKQLLVVISLWLTIPLSLGPLSWVQVEKGFVLSRCCSDSAFEKLTLFLD